MATIFAALTIKDNKNHKNVTLKKKKSFLHFCKKLFFNKMKWIYFG